MKEPHYEVTPLPDHWLATQMWMLGFDKASTFTSTMEDVTNKLVTAFLENEPYYPRPDVDEDLWKTFREEYLKASQKSTCLRGDRGDVEMLAEFSVDKVERVLTGKEGSGFEGDFNDA